MIQGVTVQDLNVMEDDRGFLYEILTQRQDPFEIKIPVPIGATNDEVNEVIQNARSSGLPIGEKDIGDINHPEIPHVYIATARPGVAKAWHMHTKQADRFCVVHGTAKIGLIDLRGPIFKDTRSFCAMRDHISWTWGDDTFEDRIEDMIKDHHRQMVNPAHGMPNQQILDRVWSEMVGETEWGKTFMTTQTVVLSGDRPKLLTIPPFVAHGQMAISEEMSYLLNLPTEVFDRDNPDEIRIPCNAFEKMYSWEVISR